MIDRHDTSSHPPRSGGGPIEGGPEELPGDVSGPDYRPPTPPPAPPDRHDPPSEPEIPTRDERPSAPPPSDTGSSSDIDPEEAGLYWKEQVLTEGTQDYMQALIDGDPRAVAALKDPTFMTILQQKMNEENQRMSLISNLINVQHRTLMASVNNMRV